jgi:hypothetical protein
VRPDALRTPDLYELFYPDRYFSAFSYKTAIPFSLFPICRGTAHTGKSTLTATGPQSRGSLSLPPDWKLYLNANDTSGISGIESTYRTRLLMLML